MMRSFHDRIAQRESPTAPPDSRMCGLPCSLSATTTEQQYNSIGCGGARLRGAAALKGELSWTRLRPLHPAMGMTIACSCRQVDACLRWRPPKRLKSRRLGTPFPPACLSAGGGARPLRRRRRESRKAAEKLHKLISSGFGFRGGTRRDANAARPARKDFLTPRTGRIPLLSLVSAPRALPSLWRIYA